MSQNGSEQSAKTDEMQKSMPLSPNTGILTDQCIGGKRTGAYDC